MLICHVTLRPVGRLLTADIAESGAAADSPGTGNIIFAALVDDPAALTDHVDAFLGQILRETASANDVTTAGLIYSTAVSTSATATDAPNASITPLVTTWSPTDKGANVTLSNGNLTLTSSSQSAGSARATKSRTTGQVYFEITVTGTAPQNQGFAACGVASAAMPLNSMTQQNNNVAVSFGSGTAGFVYAAGVDTTLRLGAGFSSGDICCVAVDFTNSKVWLRRNGGNWNGSASYDPATNAGGVTFSSGGMSGGVPIFPCTTGQATGNPNNTLNVGATTFAFSVPSGFVAWG